MEKQAHVYYSGRVQGVGFRFTVVEFARELKISGWVRNLADGRVELLAQAQENTVKDFLSKINAYFSSYIRDAHTEWQQISDQLEGFKIKF